MAGRIDYKQKYEELKAKFMSSVDSAWQDGYQHGMADSQTEQAQMQQQQQDAMNQAAAGAPMPGQPGEENDPGMDQNGPADDKPGSEHPNGSELDQHIEKLESMLGKTELAPLELQDLKKTLSDIRSLQVQITLAKSMDSIKNTKLAKSYLSLSPKNQANLPEPAKKSLSLQEKIVGDILNKWAADESKASKNILSVVSGEGLTKKD